MLILYECIYILFEGPYLTIKLHSIFILLQVDKSSIKVKGVKRHAKKTGESLPAAENELHNIQPEKVSSLRGKTVGTASLTGNLSREGSQVLLTNEENNILSV